MTNSIKTYDFPNAFIHKMNDGSYVEQQKWCLRITTRRSRGYVADALMQLRRYKKSR